MSADFIDALRPLFDCLTDGVCIADADGNLLYANAAAGRLLGPPAQDAARASICDLLCGKIGTESTGKAQPCALKIPRGPEDSVTVKGPYGPTGREIRLRCLRVRQPSVERHFLIIEDVTVQAEIGRRREEWRQMLAHDLRAPLTIMHGVLRAVEDLGAGHALDKNDLELLSSGLRNSKRLNDLIDSYLETTRLEDGAVPVHAASVNLDGLLAGVVSEQSETARSAGLTLALGPASGLTARADQELLSRAVTNLLVNALKFTPRGGRIIVEAERSGKMTLVRVKDNGPGIAPSDAPHIFDRFYQGSGVKPGQGLGLGLAFCRAAMRAMGGEASVESTAGKGSVFTLSLPAAAREDPS